MPSVVDDLEWRRAVLEFREREKALTRELDGLNAARRRLPMTRVDPGHVLTGVEGERTLLDLFDGRRQLIV